MNAYDSESSGAEDDYIETNVLLGYPAKEPSDDTISHLGGRPTWLDPDFPPPAALAKCKVCKDLMVLLLQLNGNLPEHFPGHERRLYVLTCRRKTCRRRDGSIRVLRGVRISESSARDRQKTAGETAPKPASSQLQAKAVTHTNIGETLFGVKPVGSSSSLNPFSTSTSNTMNSRAVNASSTSANPFSTSSLPHPSELAARPAQESTSTTDLPKSFASAVSLNTTPPTHRLAPPPEPWPKDSDFPSPYPTSYLVDADYETLDNTSHEASVTRQQTIDIDEESGSIASKEDKDAYESPADKTFQKFADRLAQNPEQVIRYEFQGHPLLYSKSDAVGKLIGAVASAPAAMITVGSRPGAHSRIPRCENCGAGRVFEVQLTPHAITELEAEAEDAGLEGMEWGTIIVGVCERDCVPRGTQPDMVGYVEEWAGVQWEEVKERR